MSWPIAADREPVIRARTMCVDWVIRSFIDIFSSVVALATASRARLARRWNEVRIRPLFSTPWAGCGRLRRNDLIAGVGGILWTFDTRLRQIDPDRSTCRPAGILQ